MNKLLSIALIAILSFSLVLMGASCTKKEKNPDKTAEETTGAHNEDTDGAVNKDPEDTKKEEGSASGESHSDTTVKGEIADTSKEESKDTSKVDKDEKDTEKSPVGSSSDSKDTEKADKETAYQPAPMTYKEFISLSPADQQAYFEQFEDIEDYMKWYNDALEEYEKEQNKQEIDGVIDLGEIINGGN